ncbi:hypothetical protein MTR67_008505 [Solanum verrucosum]|uniref:Cystatin domain-containing protein n=1 Tax=Solanum verrucosum TaxID=315347 RepID=A0AAF0Q5C5_SOLVR|nr:hypothetical protein MTR67_008505 [Solanum verrucosum]
MSEVHPRAGKRKLEEDCLATEGHGVEKPFQYVIKTFIGKDGEEYYDSDDDEIRYADGGRVSVRHQKEYYRQIRESENTNYKFVEIVTLNTSPAAGIWCYITFLATDSDDSNAAKTFQALVWRGINKKIEVIFCRLKKQGDKKPLDSDIDVKATQ